MTVMPGIDSAYPTSASEKYWRSAISIVFNIDQLFSGLYLGSAGGRELRSRCGDGM